MMCIFCKIKFNNYLNNKRFYFSTALLIIFFSSWLQAQFTKSLKISSFYDDNLFRSPEAVNDFLTDASVGLNYQPAASNLNFNYNGSFYLYQDNAVRNFSLHSMGLEYAVPFGDDDQNNFNTGVEYTLRKNGDAFNYYNYNQTFVYISMHYDPEWIFIRSGYNFRYRDYANLPDLTNYQHQIFLQLNKSFETRTTLIAEIDWGWKLFSGQNTFYHTTSTGGGGRGHGRMADSSTITTVSSADIPSLSQAIFLIRATQSLFEKAGLYIQYRRQFSLTSETSFKNSDDYYQDEELFDDPFSYESQGVSSQFTWILPWAMKLQLGGVMESKNYISEQAYVSAEDSEGSGGIRNDEHRSYFISVSKIINIDKAWMKSLHFVVDYNYIHSNSNSYWYNYTNNVLGGGIQWNF